MAIKVELEPKSENKLLPSIFFLSLKGAQPKIGQKGQVTQDRTSSPSMPSR